MSNFFKYRNLTFCIITFLPLSTSVFSNEIGLIGAGKGTYYIDPGSTITGNFNTTITGLSAASGDHYSVVNNGLIHMDLNTITGSITGVYSSLSGIIDLGSQSKLLIHNNAGASAYGIDVKDSSAVIANNLTLVLDHTATLLNANTRGLNVFYNGKIVLTGKSSITVNNNRESAKAIFVFGQPGQKAEFSAEDITILTNGTGIEAQSFSETNLTGVTEINSEKAAIQAYGNNYYPNTGGVVNAKRVKIKTTNTNLSKGAEIGGIYASQGGRVFVGDGSSIETENMHGLHATSYAGYPTIESKTVIDYRGSEDNRNTINVQGLSGVLSNGSEAIVNLDYTDISATSKNSNSVGLWANSGGAINASNTAITVSDLNTDFKNIAAVLSRYNGPVTDLPVDSTSIINLSNHTFIDASNTENKIALKTEGNNSKINITDTAVISGNVVASGNDTEIKMDLKNNSFLKGATHIIAENNGTTYSGSMIKLKLTDSKWLMTESSEITSLELNTGSTLELNASPTNPLIQGNTLKIQGEYIGNNGTIIFNSKLESDDSIHDKLVVEGNTSGTTNVKVNNLGGQGAQTIEGIELIQVNGQSQGDFKQAGRITAGLYDYSLQRGATDKYNNWYLTSSPFDDSDSSTVRPEVGAYISNLSQANNMFDLRLFDRIGAIEQTNTSNKEFKPFSQVWMRNTGSYTSTKSANGQLKTDSHNFAVQLGGDVVQWSSNETDLYLAGVMGGYGFSRNKTKNNRSDYTAKSDVNGYSVGVYGTYFADSINKLGLYVDTWAQYNWFKNKINGQDIADEKYDSKGVTVSAESGYNFLLNATQNNNHTRNWYLQPKIQLTYFGLKMDDVTEENGTHVSGVGQNNLRTRIGLRGFLSQGNTNDNISQHFKPFVEINWINNSKNYGVLMDGESVSQQGTGNIGELKLGVDGNLNNSMQVWFNLAQQAGGSGYHDTKGMLGIQYSF